MLRRTCCDEQEALKCSKNKSKKLKREKKKKVAFRASNLKAVLHRNFVKKEKKKGPKSLRKKHACVTS